MKVAPPIVEIFDPIDRIVHGAGMMGLIGAILTGPFLEFPGLAKSLGLQFMPAPGVHPIFAMIAVLAWAIHLVRVCIHWLSGESTTGLLFRFRDLSDMGKALLWGAFVGNKPQKLGRFSYKERIPYTVLIFVLPMLALSGFSVAHPAGSLALLKGSGLLFMADLHTNAVLFILPFILWHIYFAHFQPEILFWNGAWLSGKAKFDRIERLRPAWAAEFMDAVEPEESAKPKAPNVEDILAAGNLAAREGKYQDAEKAYLDALAHYPGYSQALFNLGVVRRRAGNTSGARESFSQFLEQDPFNPLAAKAKESLEALEKESAGGDKKNG